ncbi:MAG: PorV/PorQ family protein [Bacteroidetes bacterium]|nr:PorV/PorQ family protein [Bacteroidota bacterium]MBU1114504.1 PorV/PorQ family protein [Bacteroidota bacterium]MBU1797868.1 PorV/PorQ family protein [Bacteroidota bacterium]
MKFKFIILLSIVISSTTIFSQTNFDISKRATTVASFLSISQGAKATGMGSAFVALVDDQSAIYWNVAGLTDLTSNGILFENTNWIAGINYNYLAGSFNLGSWGTIGLSFISSNIEDMDVTTIEDPEGTGETFSVSDVAFSVAYAIKLTDNFSIGFNPKFISQKIWRMSATAIAIDMGVKYVTPFDGIVLGMSISNFGTPMRLQGKSALVLYDPNPNTSINNDKIPAELQTESWELPLNFRAGIAYSPLNTNMHKILVAIDALHPSDDYESINLGAEYTFSDVLSIRGGYKSLFLPDTEESFTLGLGLKVQFLNNIAAKVDYAYVDFGRLSNVQKFSLSILL